MIHVQSLYLVHELTLQQINTLYSTHCPKLSCLTAYARAHDSDSFLLSPYLHPSNILTSSIFYFCSSFSFVFKNQWSGTGYLALRNIDNLTEPVEL